MKKLGIVFYDNDFTLTIRNFLMLFGENGWRYGGNLTKEDISKLFNQCAGSIYWISQNGCEYNKDSFQEIPEFKYLTIEPENVYFDNEVDEFITKNDGWFNSEFHYIVFGIKYKISSI